jgi:hypothetical protein
LCPIRSTVHPAMQIDKSTFQSGFILLPRDAVYSWCRFPFQGVERHFTMSPARLEARMDSLFSFPVGLFHPLQHAGLSRRSTYNRDLGE